jgi:predicted Zn-dependent protease
MKTKYKQTILICGLIISVLICELQFAQDRNKRGHNKFDSKKNLPKASETRFKNEYSENTSKSTRPECTTYKQSKNDDYKVNQKKYAPKNQNDYKDFSDNKPTDNYFKVEKKNNSLWNGKHWDIEDYPLKVYINKGKSKYLKQIYIDYVDYGFQVWQKADSRIKYKITNIKEESDIEIAFIENLMDKYEECYLGLTNYKLGKQKKITHSYIQISLLKFDDVRISDGEIKATIIHEIGHAFGLGHSNNENDLMYPYIDSNHTSEMNYSELSKGDKEAVRSVINLGESYTYEER